MVTVNAKKIKFLMYKNELNHRELAELAKITRETVTRILNGKTRIRKITAIKIAKAFKVDILEIIRGGIKNDSWSNGTF